MVGTPSDYSDADNWLALPEITKAADTIYFYPTAYNDPSETAADICSIDNADMRAKARELYEQQATAFADATNVFAPGVHDAQVDTERGVVVCTTSGNMQESAFALTAESRMCAAAFREIRPLASPRFLELKIRTHSPKKGVRIFLV